MRPTRREAAALVLAFGATATSVQAEGPAPLVVADGGAAAQRPYGTAEAYDLAIRQGADFLGADLVPSRDGALVVRRDHELSADTDIAMRPEFAARHAERALNETSVGGWFTEDFTLAELETLTCGAAGTSARGARGAGARILTLQEVIDLARAGSVRTARVVGVCATLVRPSYFASQGLQLESRLADAIRAAGYDSGSAAMLACSFEVGALKTLGDLSRVRRVQRLASEGAPADQPETPFSTFTTDSGLAAVRGWAEAIGPTASQCLDLAAGPDDAAALPIRARAAGLATWAWGPAGEPRRRLAALFAAGVAGVASPDPGAAAKARRDARRG